MLRSDKMVQVDIVYSKMGLMRYISHLDLNRTFQRAIRRSQLPVAYTKGFNPRPRISYERALALGNKSRSERMTVCLTEQILPSVFKRKFQAELPGGIRIRKVVIKRVL